MNHEAQVDAALQGLGHRISFARDAEEVAHRAFGDQRQPECQQQTVQMVELVQVAQHQSLDEHAEHADHHRRCREGNPVVHAQVVESEQGQKGAEHVERAVREVDDVEQAENDRQAQAQHGIERAVDQPEQQLPEQFLVT
jgi:hypothetical protein